MKDGDLRPGPADEAAPTLIWLRRDLRLADNPVWQLALSRGGPVVPVFILDPLVEEMYGAAPKWRLGQSIRSLSADLEAKGSRLILRRGTAKDVLNKLVAETGARRVVWSRLYDLRSIQRDTKIKAALAARGTEAESTNASLLFEPWSVATKAGGPFRVFTPFWNAVRDRTIEPPQAAPKELRPPADWPASDPLARWDLGRAMHRGAAIVARHAVIGEAAAQLRLDRFIEDAISRYKSDRDFPARHAVSGLSENLTYGEIAPHRLWYAGMQAARADGRATQAEHFLKELAWREFAYHLLFHTPHLETACWNEAWERFPWRDDNEMAEQWRRGMTGIEMVDAAMREMYVTGTMHNRTRMLAASFLTKHLMTHWRVGADWFRQCLIDWDIASNAMGWQWAAGCGPDAAPFFRVFNPDVQANKFDADRRYRDRFIAEGRRRPHEDALAYFAAIPQSMALSPDQPYPRPIVELADGRNRALEAYKANRRPADDAVEN